MADAPFKPVEGATSADSSATFDDVSADAMWATISSWRAPYITAAEGPVAVLTVTGEGEGSKRLLSLLPDLANPALQFHEELVRVDAAGKSFSYRFCDGAEAAGGSPFPVEKYGGTVTVTPVGDGCRVHWIGWFDVVAGKEAPDISGLYASFIASAAGMARKA